jgi:hypothetical protein
MKELEYIYSSFTISGSVRSGTAFRARLVGRAFRDELRRSSKYL